MRAAAANAMELAHRLSNHAAVSAVLYPGLPHHPGHDVALRQMQGGFGGMLSIRVRGGAEAAIAAAARVTLWKRATSLGGVELLIEHRASYEGARLPLPARPPAPLRRNRGRRGPLARPRAGARRLGQRENPAPAGHTAVANGRQSGVQEAFSSGGFSRVDENRWIVRPGLECGRRSVERSRRRRKRSLFAPDPIASFVAVEEDFPCVFCHTPPSRSSLARAAPPRLSRRASPRPASARRQASASGPVIESDEPPPPLPEYEQPPMPAPGLYLDAGLLGLEQ